MLPTAQTAAVPTCNFSIECREDHMDEALADLNTALLFITDPIAKARIENARRHLVAFNEWHADAIGSRPVEVA